VCDSGGGALDDLRSIVDLASQLVSDFEIILVDNGSDAASAPDYEAITGVNGLPNVQVFRLIAKVDPEIAAWAGVENSLGDYVFVLDPLDEALSLLPRALDEAVTGRDVVFIRNVSPRRHTCIERFSERIFRGLFRLLSGIDPDFDVPRSRLLSKRLIAILLEQPKPALRYRSLHAASGLGKTTLLYSAPRHEAGDERLWSRARRAAGLVLSTTMAPLRIVSIFALMGAVLNLLYSVYVLVIAIASGRVQPGWTTLSLQQSGMFFLLSIVVFVLSEYLAHALRWSLEGPPYFIASELTSTILTRRQKLNVDPKTSLDAPQAID
jgi:glycosyltransferase involved in cell wall biosynthesis